MGIQMRVPRWVNTLTEGRVVCQGQRGISHAGQAKEDPEAASNRQGGPDCRILRTEPFSPACSLLFNFLLS